MNKALEKLYQISKDESGWLEEIGCIGHKDVTLRHAQKYILGTVEIEVALDSDKNPIVSSINVWVIAYPARFWAFEIDVGETGERYIVSTGSGNPRKYWEVVRLIAEGMLDITKANTLSHETCPECESEIIADSITETWHCTNCKWIETHL